MLGGGVAGIAIASKLSDLHEEVVLIEKNNLLAQETSSRNSEVIHAGIYYKEGSLKSELCLQGKHLLYDYLSTHNIPFIKCGKFILATTEEEEEKLFDIYDNGISCGVNDLVINKKDIEEYNLNYKSSIFSPSTGIFDSHLFINSLKNFFERNKGILLLGNQLKQINFVNGSFELMIEDLNNGSSFLIRTKNFINCAGLDAHKITNEVRGIEKYKSAYKKGEYYSYLGKEKLNHLIYPVFGEFSLGIHATIDLGKGIRFGPSSYDIEDLDYAISEEQRDHFFNAIRTYWPSIDIEHLEPSYSGIRPLLEGHNDFIIDPYHIEEAVFISILGYASPGLTSSLALAEKIINQK